MPVWLAPTPAHFHQRIMELHMGKRITLIQGHPDTDEARLCHAIGRSYEEAATGAGHVVRSIDVARLEFPLIRTRRDFESALVPEVIRIAQQDIRWAEHLVIVYPLWLGTLPALLKGFFEQTFRYGFALGTASQGRMPKRLLAGRSARIFVTMGMPAAAYRLLFRAHGLKSLESGILRISGIRPIRATLFGSVEGAKPARRAQWLDEVRRLGRRAQ
jgi:putative NADPH-quinone reductase